LELVYLWVEDYKNIHKQGFNFSPRFECKYDEDSNELTIENKNKDYVNIFPKDINVTAIVGQNGSGKSGLLEAFMLTIFNHSNPDITIFNMRGFCIFHKKEGFYFKLTANFSATYSLQFTKRNAFLKEEIDNNSIMMLHYNYSLDMLSSKFMKSLISNEYDGHISDYETTPNNLFSQPKKYNAQINIQQTNRETQKYMIKSKQEYGEIDIKRIFNNTFKENENIQFIPHSFILHFDYTNYLEKFTNINIRKLIKNYFIEEDFNDINIEKLTKLSYVFFVFQLYSAYTMTPNLFKQIDINLIHILESIYSQDKISDDFINKIIDQFKKIINNSSLIKMCSIEIQTTFPSIYETAWYIDYIKGNLETLKKHDVNLFHKKTIIDIELIENLINNLPSFIEIELYNKKDISFSDLSFGEKAIIRLSYNMMFFLNFYSRKRKIFYILLDEIDLGLHPEWQKKLFNFSINLTNLLSKKLNVKITIIIASHSPFILSDIPKRNVIFLEKYKKYENKNQKEGNCKIATPDIKQTFGANIHTLLSNGFFMENGLMGKFAKEKINEVIKLLNSKRKLSKKNQKFCENIISIIGEPILQKTLEQQLKEKLNPNETELQKLEREQKEIEDKIKELKGNQ
jgi:energy-coupling factor transporter ATP-binding protein EcfA2